MRLLQDEPQRRKLTGQLIWFLAWLGVTAFGLYLSPSRDGHGTHQQLGMPPCPSVLMFDRPCPGCGLTTSWTALLHGQLTHSFRAHPLGPPLYAIFAVSAIAGIVAFFRRRRIAYEEPLLTRGMIAILCGFMAFGTVRMLTTTKYASPSEKLLWHMARKGDERAAPSSPRKPSEPRETPVGSPASAGSRG